MTYAANGYHYTLERKLTRGWSIYRQSAQPGGTAMAYELVHSHGGKFPPPNDAWGIHGYTFSRSTHSDPLQAAIVKFSAIAGQ